MVFREVMSRIAVGAIFVSLALGGGASAPAWEDLPDAVRQEAARLLTLANEATVAQRDPEWRSSERPTIRLITGASTEDSIIRISYANYYVLVSPNGREVTELRHNTAYQMFRGSVLILSTDEAVARGERFLVAATGCSQFVLRDVRVDAGAQYWITMTPADRGVPHSDFGGAATVTVDGGSGRILYYDVLHPRETYGPHEPAFSPYDASTAAGLAMAESLPNSSWEIGPARLCWASPGWWNDFNADVERYERVRCERKLILFYQIGMRRLERAMVAYVFVDAITGRVGGYLDFEGGRSATAKRAPLPKLAAGPASITYGGVRRDTHRAGILWTRATLPATGHAVAITCRGSALSVLFDPGRGVLIDPITLRAGLPTPTLRRVLSELTGKRE